MVRLGDSLLVLVAMLVAYGLHDALSGRVPLLQTQARPHSFVLAAYLTLPLWLAVIVLTGQDRVFERLWTKASIVLGVVRVHLIGAGLLLALLWAAQIVVNRSIVVLFVLTSFALLLTSRLLVARWVQHQFEAGHGRQRLLLVGDPAHAPRVLVELSRQPMAPVLVGHVATDESEVRAVGVDHLGGVSQFADILHEQAVDHVLLLPPFDRPAEAARILTLCGERGVSVEFLLPADETGMRFPRVTDLHGIPVMTYDAPPKRAELLAAKHLFDTAAAAIGLLVISPLLLTVALVILLSSGRPVLFGQERIGLNGRRFKMLKFRTMVKDAEQRKASLAHLNEAGGPVFKLTRDPRITPFGAFLRRTSIDELPQLFNVLSGNMSLVGPRPLPVAEQQNIHGAQRRRLAMKPGITGLWQVSGRSNITFDDWMTLDLKYVDELSPWKDVVILARTVPAVLFARGAR